MSPRTGRPKSENPKSSVVKLRADQQTISDLEYCCEHTGLTRSDVIRLGIRSVKAAIENGLGKKA